MPGHARRSVATPPAPQPKAPAAATSVATMDASVVSAVNPQPLGLWSDAVLMAAGAVVRSQHPLAVGLVLSAATQVLLPDSVAQPAPIAAPPPRQAAAQPPWGVGEMEVYSRWKVHHVTRAQRSLLS